MRFFKSVTLLAALSSSAVAHLDGHAHRRAHQARGVSTVTITNRTTKTVCPCESSTVSSSSVAPTTTSTTTSTTMLEHSTTTTSTSTSTSTSEYTPTSTPEPTTSVIPTTSTSSVATSTSSSVNAAWTSIPSDGVFSTAGFGGVTEGYYLTPGNDDTYAGNVGSPYGSNIQEVSESEASSYKYVVQFKGSDTSDWIVKMWNKISADGKMDSWFGKASHSFTIAAGETKYYAFDENTEGGWAAAEGSTMPTNTWGEYAATWGEITFGDIPNGNNSGYDVSAITAKSAGMTIQGMQICSHTQNAACSVIMPGGTVSTHAWLTDTDANTAPVLQPGAARLTVKIDYQG